MNRDVFLTPASTIKPTMRFSGLADFWPFSTVYKVREQLRTRLSDPAQSQNLEFLVQTVMEKGENASESDPLEYAKTITEVLKTGIVSTNPDWTIFKQMVRHRDLPSFEAIFQKTLNPLLNLAVIKSLSDPLSQKVISLNAPDLEKLPDVCQLAVLRSSHAVTARNIDLFLSGYHGPPEAFVRTLQHFLKHAHPLRANLEEIPAEAILTTTLNHHTTAESLNQALTTVNRLLDSSLEKPELQSAYLRLCRMIPDPEALSTFSRIAKVYYKNGGDPGFLADMVVHHPEILSFPNAKMTSFLENIGPAIAKFPKPQEARQFEKSLAFLWSCIPETTLKYAAIDEDVDTPTEITGLFPTAEIMTRLWLDNAELMVDSGLAENKPFWAYLMQMASDPASHLAAQENLSHLLRLHAENKPQAQRLIDHFNTPALLLKTASWLMKTFDNPADRSRGITLVTSHPYTQSLPPQQLQDLYQGLSASLKNYGSPEQQQQYQHAHDFLLAHGQRQTIPEGGLVPAIEALCEREHELHQNPLPPVLAENLAPRLMSPETRPLALKQLTDWQNFERRYQANPTKPSKKKAPETTPFQTLLKQFPQADRLLTLAETLGEKNLSPAAMLRLVNTLGGVNPPAEVLKHHVPALTDTWQAQTGSARQKQFETLYQFLVPYSQNSPEALDKVLDRTTRLTRACMENPALAEKLPPLIPTPVGQYVAKQLLQEEDAESMVSQLIHLAGLEDPIYQPLLTGLTKPETLFSAVHLLQTHTRNPEEQRFLTSCLLLPSEKQQAEPTFYTRLFASAPSLLKNLSEGLEPKALLESLKTVLASPEIKEHPQELIPAALALMQLDWPTVASYEAMEKNPLLAEVLEGVIHPETRNQTLTNYADFMTLAASAPKAMQALSQHLKKSELILEAAQGLQPFMDHSATLNFIIEWIRSKNAFAKMSPEGLKTHVTEAASLAREQIDRLDAASLTDIFNDYWSKGDKEPAPGYWPAVKQVLQIVSDIPELKADFSELKPLWQHIIAMSEDDNVHKRWKHLLPPEGTGHPARQVSHQLTGNLAAAAQNYNLKKACLQMVNAFGNNIDAALTMVNLLRKFNDAGANPLYLADYVVSRPPLLKRSGRDLHHLFEGLDTLAQKYQHPEERNAMRRSMELIWDKYKLNFEKPNFVPMTDRITQIILGLPFIFNRDTLWQFVQNKLDPAISPGDIQTYTDTLKRMFGDNPAINQTVSNTYLYNNYNAKWASHVKTVLEACETMGLTDQKMITGVTNNYDRENPVIAKITEIAQAPPTNPQLKEAYLKLCTQLNGSAALPLLPTLLDCAKTYADHGGDPNLVHRLFGANQNRSGYPSREYTQAFFQGLNELIQAKPRPDKGYLEVAAMLFWQPSRDSREILDKIQESTRILMALPPVLSDEQKWNYIKLLNQQNKGISLMKSHADALDAFNAEPKLASGSPLSRLYQTYFKNNDAALTLNLILKSVTRYVQAGGSATFIVDFLTSQRSGKNFLSRENIEKKVLPLADSLTVFDTPEKQRVLQETLENLFTHSAVETAETLHQATLMALSIPPTISQEARWEFIGNQCQSLAKNPAALIQKRKHIQEVFTSLEADPQLAMKVFELLKANHPMDATTLSKQLSQQYQALNFDTAGYPAFLETVHKTLQGSGGIPPHEARSLWQMVLANAARNSDPQGVLKDVGEIWSWFDSAALREFRIPVLEHITQLPHSRTEIAQAIRHVLAHKFLPGEVLNNPEQLKNNLGFLANMSDPNTFINDYLLNPGKVHPGTIHGMFSYLESGDPKTSAGQRVIPELMAMLGPYVESLQNVPGIKVTDYTVQAIKGLNKLTQLQLNNFEPTAFNNYVRIGTLGLSFSKWKFDTLTRWRGQGDQEKPAIFEASQIYRKTGKRVDDHNFHGGFQMYDPKTGVSVEMRRAYIVISKAGLGTLVIRNSGPVFGRDKLAAPAYYHPTRSYTQGDDLFLPEQDLSEAYHGESFQSIFSKKFHDRATQDQIKALLDAFDSSLIAFQNWKSGFKDGKPSPGFPVMLETSLRGAKNDGADSPFRPHKPTVHLAWINRYGLPFPVQKFDVSDPAHQAEMDFYHRVLNQEITITNPDAYQQNMPNLLAFLSFGLERQLELILSE